MMSLSPRQRLLLADRIDAHYDALLAWIARADPDALTSTPVTAEMLARPARRADIRAAIALLDRALDEHALPTDIEPWRARNALRRLEVEWWRPPRRIDAAHRHR
jgi:hypothetical protein